MLFTAREMPQLFCSKSRATREMPHSRRRDALMSTQNLERVLFVLLCDTYHDLQFTKVYLK